jgi:hypothetical protein
MKKKYRHELVKNMPRIQSPTIKLAKKCMILRKYSSKRNVALKD